jgi:hypothetical protein
VTLYRPCRCAACGRDLPPRGRALLGYWPTVRDLMIWLAEDDGSGAGPDLLPVWVCRGRCGAQAMRQRMAAEACAGRVER